MDKLREIFNKYKEIIMYLIFGVCSTVVSWGSYALFVKLAGLSVELGNILSWVCAVLFAFVTNKLWVFESKSWEPQKAIPEFFTFVGSRLITGIIEMVGVPLLVRIGLSQTIFGVEGMFSKILVSVIVVILNYVFSKLIIFRNKKEEAEEKVDKQ